MSELTKEFEEAMLKDVDEMTADHDLRYKKMRNLVIYLYGGLAVLILALGLFTVAFSGKWAVLIDCLITLLWIGALAAAQLRIQNQHWVIAQLNGLRRLENKWFSKADELIDKKRSKNVEQ